MKKLMLLLFLCLSNQLFASVEPISADRPDQSESAKIIPKGFFQIETGFVYESENSDNVNSFSYDFLAKYGVVEDLELRLNSSYKSLDIHPSRVGFTPLTFGLKYRIYDGNTILPAIGVIAQMQFAELAASDFKLINNAPAFILLLEKDLSKDLSNSANMLVQWDGIVDKPYYSYSYSLGYSLSENSNVFVEIYGDVFSDATPTHKLDFGATYIINDNWCVDISAGKTLTNKRYNSDYFYGIGSSFRF